MSTFWSSSVSVIKASKVAQYWKDTEIGYIQSTFCTQGLPFDRVPDKGEFEQVWDLIDVHLLVAL